jgi:putative hydrolase of the HAD superfamily
VSDPHAIIFDLFDTLVPGGSRASRDAVSHAMAEDLGVNRARFTELFKGSFRERWHGALGSLEETIAALTVRAGGTPTDDAVRRAARRRIDFTRRQITPSPRLLALLDALRADGWRLGLISNCSAEIPALWAANPLAQRITAPVFSCVAGRCKPDPEIYRLAAASLGTTPAQCVFVADGAGGELPGAQAAGMQTIRVRADSVDHGTYGDIGQWEGTTIDTLNDLPPALIEQSKDPAPTTAFS